ncbi:MAG: succinate dehydrogenase [Pseudomonadota bacterium]
MVDIRLYMAQRISALIMLPLIIGHIVMMIVAVQGGLTAGEILSRTQGSVGWALYYGIFVIAVAVHASIGVRTIAHEWAGVPQRWLGALTMAIAVGLTLLGLRAVYAVVA